PHDEVVPAVRAGRGCAAAFLEPGHDLQAELLRRHQRQVPRPEAQGLCLPQVAGAARAVSGRDRRDPTDGRKPRARDQRHGGRSLRVPPLRDLMSWFSTWPESAPGGLDPKVKAALEAGGPVPEYRTQPLAEVRRVFNET